MEVGRGNTYLPDELDGISHQEGSFVGIPIQIGSYSCTALGFIIIAPIESGGRFLLMMPQNLRDSAWHSRDTFGRFGGYIVGLPQYVLKKTFCDCPYYNLEFNNRIRRISNKAAARLC